MTNGFSASLMSYLGRQGSSTKWTSAIWSSLAQAYQKSRRSLRATLRKERGGLPFIL